MIIACDSCGTTYNIADDKVRGRRVRVRCKTCGGAIVVDGQQLPHEDQTRPMSLADARRNLAASFEDEDESTRVINAPPTYHRPAASGTRSAPPPRAAPPPPAEEWTVNFSDTDSRSMTLAAIVEAYTSGELPDDAFAWKAGMDDWYPVLEVPEIRDAIASATPTRVASVSSARGPAAPVAHAAPPVQPAATYEPPPARNMGAARVAARAQPGRQQRPDLFSGARAAGSEEDLLANTSEPPELEAYGEKPTGARNESSVLFSLNAVKAGRASVSAPPRSLVGSPQTAADILGMGSSSAPSFDMATNAALLTAAPVEPEPPPRISMAAAAPQRARMDTTPPVARRGRSGLVWMLVGVIGTAVVLGVVATAFMLSRGMPLPFPVPGPLARYVPIVARVLGAPPPTTTPSATPAPTETASAAATPSALAAPPPTGTEPAAPAASAAATTAAPAATSPAATPMPAARPGGGKASSAKSTAEAASAGGNIPKVVLEEEAGGAAKPAASGPAFDTAAAKAALEGAAAAAAACKQPDGPTGSGKVQVTFASSGQATSVNIIAGDFGGTPVGMCILRAFRAAKVPAFSGDAVTVSKKFTVAP